MEDESLTEDVVFNVLFLSDKPGCSHIRVGTVTYIASCRREWGEVIIHGRAVHCRD